MKYWTRYAAVALSGLTLFACGGNDPAVPVTDPTTVAAPVQKTEVHLDSAVDRYSYALGLDLGKAIANISVPLKLDVLMEAIQDQVDTSRKILLNDTAAEAALQDLLLQMQRQKDNEEAAAASKALQEEAQFLALNIQDSNVLVTTKGVQYKVLREGTGLTPKASDKVEVHYVGALLDGTEFDNSVKRGEPLEFPVSAVIEGWQDLLLVMKEGMKVKAWIPSALGYGEAGVPPMIPANALLVFEVELLKVFAEVPPADSSAPAAEAIPTDAQQAAPVEGAPAAEPAKASAAPAAKNTAAESAKSAVEPVATQPAEKATTKPAEPAKK